MSTEETIHAKFGFDLVNTIKAEHPEWWVDAVKEQIVDLANEAVDAECQIVKWVVGDDEELFFELVSFIYHRMNISLKEIGVDYTFIHFKQGEYDFSWFDLLVSGTQATDFFASKSVAYSKGLQSFDEGSLF